MVNQFVYTLSDEQVLTLYTLLGIKPDNAYLDIHYPLDNVSKPTATVRLKTTNDDVYAANCNCTVTSSKPYTT